jgi:hypothetical protein
MLSGMMRRAYDFGSSMIWAGRFFVENGSELGFGDDFLENGEFCPVEIVPALCLGHGGDIEGPNADFCNLEQIEDVHGNRVGALVVEVSSDPAAEPFIGLANVDWFSVVIEECVNAPLVTADSATIFAQAPEEGVDLLVDSSNVSRG